MVRAGARKQPRREVLREHHDVRTRLSGDARLSSKARNPRRRGERHQRKGSCGNAHESHQP